MTYRFAPVVLVLAGLLAGCATETTTSTGNPYPPVPPPIAESRPLPPVSAQALMWQPGHWDWNGSGYVWQKGQYVPGAGHGPLFQPGYWTQTPSGWSWQPAHWTS
ncbi:MAG TPA: hypothetical protein VFN42_04660 [Acetobacteraceae bacterium]|nr:hypothetical protein [Acetobacteraceae bacterium]